MVSLVGEGKKNSDIINARHNALANRVAAMAKSIEVEEDIVMTGGVAKKLRCF
jgi:(R)-2-hydroxyacyl-CoA dehydratese activating ATPase